MDSTPPQLSRNRLVATWLLICCTLVFAMVVLGGVTRLTGSGLSMVDWKPVTGFLPPLNETEWQASFDRYQESPEFQKVNAHMDVAAFKEIFWLEFLHRLLGRLIGIVFAVPFILFVARGYIQFREWPRYLLMFILGGAQGVLGWYMVKSGLVDDPHVSQYRLTAHLMAAFLIYAYMFWVALSLLFPRHNDEQHSWYARALGITVLVSITVISGGFVAGLKAGKIYNTFPLMGDSWIPPGVMALDPLWRNFFDNPATAQLDHRILAITTFFTIVAFWAGIRRVTLGQQATLAANAVLAIAIAQVTIGVLTLLYVVPTGLAVLHQGVAMLLFTAALFLLHSLRDSGIDSPG